MGDVQPSGDEGASGQGAAPRAEHFRPTSGRLTGALLVLAAFAVVVLVATDAGHPAIVAGAVFAGMVGWTILLRPRVSVVGDDLVLRNPVATHLVPLAAIEQLAVRQVLVLRVGDRRLTSTALGRSRRSLLNQKKAADTEPATTPASPSYGEFAEDRLHGYLDRARIEAGVRIASDEQLALADGVRTTYAWPEIVGLVGSLVACVLLAVAV